MIKKHDPIYIGKAKSLFKTDDPDRLVVEFRDDTSAFNGQKLDKLVGKGVVNNYFNTHLMERLAQENIKTHHIKQLSDNEELVAHLQMIPIEAVVRNWAAGSLCKRLGVEEGTQLDPPVFEFFLKDDALGDPMVNEDHIYMLELATADELREIRRQSLLINQLLKTWFDGAGLMLADFKMEFGIKDGELYLADEITPDGCRIWDRATGAVLDKDRFRKDMGDVVAHYRDAAVRLGVQLPQ